MSVDRSRGLHSLNAPREMRAIIERERLRADRANRPLSVCVFELEWPTTWQRRRFARLLLGRCRATDDVGWISAQKPCAVLFETGARGARCFADGAVALAARRGIKATYAIHTHSPDDSDSDGQGGSTRHAKSRPRPEWHAIHAAASERFGVRGPLVSKQVPVTPRAEVLPLQSLLQEQPRVWKRAMDVVGAAIGLIATAPVMVAASLMIRASSPGPVIFRQQRVGLSGSRFTILKFRTMVPDAEKLKHALRSQSEQDGPAFKMTNDPRVTLVGRVLRSTSLDELPQLWNVLIGNMSLVGPRPLPVDEARDCAGWHRRRLDVMPGLTCIWQVRGRSTVKFDDWMRMDMEYLRNRSFLNDVKILLLTIPAVILRRGAH